MRNPFRKQSQKEATQPLPAEAPPSPAAVTAQILPLDFAPNDPLSAYLLSAGGPVDLERLKLDSPALDALREAGVKLIVPLVSQGELIGLLNLGPRLSEQDYSSDDRELLGDLATQAAPAVRVAQLVRQQQIEAQARERLEQELRVARVIQQTLLPKELPDLPGWQVAAYWQPARAVSGDFYDFIDLPDGKLGIVDADVTDKGVPAALVMAGRAASCALAAERIPPRPARCWRTSTTCSAPIFRPTCSSPACTPCSIRHGALGLRQRRPQPARRVHGRSGGRAARHRHAAGPDAGHDL